MKNKHYPRQSYGAFYYENNFIEKQNRSKPRELPEFLKKFFFKSKFIKRNQIIGYLELEILFKNNILEKINFYNTNKKNEIIYYANLTDITLNKKRPTPKIIPKTNFSTRHVVLELPLTKWKKAKDKLELLSKLYPPEEYYFIDHLLK